LALDGCFSAADPNPIPRFHPLPPICNADLAEVLRRIHRRVLRFLEDQGHLAAPHDCASDSCEEFPDLFATLAAASILGRVALGPHSGRSIPRLQDPDGPAPSSSRGILNVEFEGFTLHAATRIPARERFRLERLARYALRPPLAHERLVLTSDGCVLLELHRPFHDGTTHLAFEPLVFLERLAALVPRPRLPLVTFHGVLAPSASLRSAIIPQRIPWRSRDKADKAPTLEETLSPPTPPLHPTPSASRRRTDWAELLRRVYRLDALRCPHCGGRRRLIALIEEPRVIERILAHLGLPTDPLRGLHRRPRSAPRNRGLPLPGAPPPGRPRLPAS
jgi:hypothetical protein